MNFIGKSLGEEQIDCSFFWVIGKVDTLKIFLLRTDFHEVC